MQNLAARARACNKSPQSIHNLPPRVRAVIREVGEEFCISDADMLGSRSDRTAVNARWMAWSKLRELRLPSGQQISYPQIGAWFRRDHTTVIYGVRRVAGAEAA